MNLYISRGKNILMVRVFNRLYKLGERSDIDATETIKLLTAIFCMADRSIIKLVVLLLCTLAMYVLVCLDLHMLFFICIIVLTSISSGLTPDVLKFHVVDISVFRLNFPGM